MLQKSSIMVVAEQFFLYPSKEHYLLEISRKAKLAHTSVRKNLKELAKQGLIASSVETKGKRKFPVYRANAENPGFRKQKIIYNISSLLESNLAEFIEEKLSPRSIVLFGSYPRGEDNEESDIDIYVECKNEFLDLSIYEKKLSRKLELHFNENFSSYNKELKNNIINGVVLGGFLEGFK